MQQTNAARFVIQINSKFVVSFTGKTILEIAEKSITSPFTGNTTRAQVFASKEDAEKMISKMQKVSKGRDAFKVVSL